MFDSLLSMILGIAVGLLILKGIEIYSKKIALEKMLVKSNNGDRTKEKEIIAWHEVGHTLMALESGLKVTEISLLPEVKNSNQLIYGKTSVHFINKLKNKKTIEEEIKIFYGGRCAELVFFNYDEDLITDGCGGDIEQATLIINKYINQLGFSKTSGMINFEMLDYESKELIEEMVQLSKRLEKETVDYLESKKELIEIIVSELMKKNKLSEKSLKLIIENFNNKLINEK